MYRHLRIRMTLMLICAVALTATHRVSTTENAMIEMADRFLKALSTEQKMATQYNFDAKQRTLWHFVPDKFFKEHYNFRRPGLNYKGMNGEQQRLAEALLSTGLGNSGFLKAMTVMSLEEVLRIQEQDTAGRRDTDKYYFSIYGSPSADTTWGWRVEGHHLSLHYTLRNGQLIAASPTFFGANPHKILVGSRKGLRALAREEDLARKLVKSLDPKQRKKALVSEKAPRDILTSAETRAKLDGQPQGLVGSAMRDNQFEMLLTLVDEYADNMPEKVASHRRKVMRDTPRDRVFFAWAGSIEPGLGDYYRVQTPHFLIEYDNTQNDNNHSHTVWRDYTGDFGRDVLALHYQEFVHSFGVDRTISSD